MKTSIAILTALALIVGGCAGFGKWNSGAQAVIDTICKPTDAQKAEAAKWLVALDNIQIGVAVAFPTAIKASSAMTVLRNGGCFVLAEIEAALILLADMQNKQAALAGLKGVPRASAEQFPVLWATVKKGK